MQEDFVPAGEGYYYHPQRRIVIPASTYDRLPSRGGRRRVSPVRTVLPPPTREATPPRGTQFADITKDPLYLIALRTDLPTLAALCQTSKRYAQICADDFFWQARTIQDYPNVNPEEGQTWKQLYEDIFTSHLYMWGDNEYGQLGNETTTEAETPFRLDEIEHPQYISCGLEFTAVVTRDGKLFTWGNNSYGQLGDGDAEVRGDDLIRDFPREIAIPEEVESVSCGVDHAAAVTRSGRLFIWGDNYYGRLGVAMTQEEYEDRGGFVAVPAEIVIPGRVASVSTGTGHTGVVTTDGRLFMWGDNGSGQLGDGTIERRREPVEIAIPGGVASLSCGILHTAVVTLDGRLFVWGSNSDGELGIGDLATQTVLVPREISNLGTVVKVACGDAHTIVLNSEGQVYVTGYRRDGRGSYNLLMDKVVMRRERQGGLLRRSAFVNIEFPERIIDIAAGSGMTALITEDGRLVSNHKEFTGTNVKMVSCGGSFGGFIAGPQK